jgi:hypothetical protein
LESRLRARLGAAGSPEYVLTWKHWDMLSGPPICALRARGRKPKDGYIGKIVPVSSPGNPSSSGHPISDSGYSGWGTPLSQHANGEPEAFLDRKRRSVERGSQMGVALSDLNMQAKAYLAGWPTPNAMHGRGVSIEKMDATGRTVDGKKHTASLEHAVKFAGWPTPQARDHFPAHTPEYVAEKKAQGHGMANLNDTATLAGWPTPRMADGEKNVRTAEGSAREIARKGGPQDTAQAATLAGWPTPTTRDHKDSGANLMDSLIRKDGKSRADLLGFAVHLTSAAPYPSPAQTGKSGASLNPYFSAWLMGFPPEWIDCRPVKATRSRKASKGA